MQELMDSAAESRLKEYFEGIGSVLGSEQRRESFAIYAYGLLGDGERKSIEPIAARACADPLKADAMHQRMLHFATDSRWSDEGVRHHAARYALQAMTQRESVEAWIIDDTGFLKQGKHSVGVQRQYTGSAGKIANCQLGVSLSIATHTEHIPIDFELYLPRSWTDNEPLRRTARVPESLQFKTKPELALDMIERALKNGITPGVLLADSAYGNAAQWRSRIRELGLHYAVGVRANTTVQVLDDSTPEGGPSVALSDLATELHRDGKFRRCTWRKGTKADLSARFAMLRVVPTHDDSDSVWLLIEWRDGDTAPSNYYFSSLPARMTKKQIITIVSQRWRTERVYEDLKGELGLDHFEGRRWPGWHHHVSVALACYCFIVAERVRRFSPSATRSLEDLSLPCAA